MAEEPMFVWIKGPGTRKLQPASAKGWLVFVIFMLVLLAPLPLLIWGAVATDIRWLPLLQFAWSGIALFAFFHFARSRSRVIDLDEMKRDWPAYLAWRDKGKPR